MGRFLFLLLDADDAAMKFCALDGVSHSSKWPIRQEYD